MTPNQRSAVDLGGRWRRLLIALGAILALLQIFRAFHGAQTRFITNDGDVYYAYAASLYLDHDLDLSNQTRTWLRLTGQKETQAPPSSGPTPTPFTVGPALLWLPAVAAADGSVIFARRLGSDVRRDGYSLPYQLFVALATLVYGLIGVWFTLRAALRWADSTTEHWPAGPALAAATALCASPAIYYLVFEPTMAHGVSIFAASIFVYAWLTAGPSSGWPRWAATGCFGGLCALIRPQDGLLLLMPVIALIASRPPLRNVGAGLPRAAAYLCGAAVAFAPQSLVWLVTYGKLLTVPQGAGFLRWGHPALPQIWLSPHHGLFTWTPIWVIAVAGLALTPRSQWRCALAAAAVFLLESYVNAAAEDWWAGDSFGARRFLSLFPVFVLGLTAVTSSLRGRARWAALVVAALAVAANLILMAAYVTNRIPHG